MSKSKSENRNRVLIAKPGLDGHDRGAKFIARALRDAGFEVVYTGIRRSPEEIAAAAVQEDVGAIGLSSLSGGHSRLFPAVLEALATIRVSDIPVLGGGVIPDEDITELKKAEQAIKASEQKYRILFEKSNDAILLIGKNKFIDCNG